MEKALRDLYLNPKSPTYLSGINALYSSAKKLFPNIKQKDIVKFLATVETYTLHKPYKNYRPGRVIASGKDSDWQADLCDMQLLKGYNKGYGFILTFVDILSKYTWGIPLKTKSSKDVTEGFRKILKSGRKPWKLHTDKGKEFINAEFQKLLKDNFILFLTCENPISKCPNIERFNRTLKRKIYKHFSLNDTLNWLDPLEQIILNYNNSISTVHGMKPINVTFEKADSLYKNQYKNINKRKKEKARFKVGDLVRITVERKKFEKSYLPSRTKEIFVISKVINRSPPVYKLSDLKNGEILTSIFYNNELAKVILK